MITLLIVLVTYLNAPTPTITPTQIQQQVAASNVKFAGYSYGTFPGFTATVMGPYVAPINKPAAFSALDAVWAIEAIVAAKGQAFYSAFFHRWFAFNTGGRAAGYTGVTYAPNLGSFDHEMVHQFAGVGEGNANDCNAVECKFIPYGDQADIMGSLGGGHPNPFFKRQGKWLDAPGVPSTQLVTTSGRYTIAPYETLGGVKALRLSPGVDSKRGSFNELFISARGGTNVGLHTCCSLIHDLDLTATRDYRLDPGQKVLFGTTLITTVSASSTGAVIDVVFNAPTAPQPPPPVQSLDLVSYLGGAADEQVRDVEQTPDGAIWVAGGSASPVLAGLPGAGNYDVFLVKYLAGVQACALRLGGPNYDRAYAVATTPSGDVILAGRAGPGFPVTPGSVQTAFGGDTTPEVAYGPQDGFVAAVGPDCELKWATYLGGADRSVIRDVAVGLDGSIYAAMTTTRVDVPFVSGARNGEDGVLVRLASNGASVLGAVYVGGSGSDGSNPSVAVDASGAYLHLQVKSSDFPVTPGAAQTVYGGGGADMALVKFSVDLSAVQWATYIGGNGNETTETHHIALFPDGAVATHQYTGSTNWPVSAGAVQSALLSVHDWGLVVVAPDGSRFESATYLGGSGDWPEGIAVDRHGRVIAAGSTGLGWGPSPGTTRDGVITMLPRDFTSRHDVRIGGSGTDTIRAAAATPTGVLVGGWTDSANLPVTPGAPQPTKASTADGWWAHVALPPPIAPPPPNPCVVDPLTLTASVVGSYPLATWSVTATDTRGCPAQASQ
jgi:hypothetical protein